MAAWALPPTDMDKRAMQVVALTAANASIAQTKGSIGVGHNNSYALKRWIQESRDAIASLSGRGGARALDA
eukprot:11176810-Lingulodinium_polyedra.AAC.1